MGGGGGAAISAADAIGEPHSALQPQQSPTLTTLCFVPNAGQQYPQLQQ